MGEREGWGEEVEEKKGSGIVEEMGGRGISVEGGMEAARGGVGEPVDVAGSGVMVNKEEAI